MAQGHHFNLMELEFYADEGRQAVEYIQLSNLLTLYLEAEGNFDFINKKEYRQGKVSVVENGDIR